jgi:hypothetical protein
MAQSYILPLANLSTLAESLSMFNRILISLGLSLMLVLSPLAATQKWVAGALTGYSTTVCGTELRNCYADRQSTA